MRRLLVLRPEPGASATVQKARERGLDAIAAPLFEIEPVEWRPPGPGGFDGLLLTSANALRHGGEALQGLRTLKAYAVGEATTAAAREEGFGIAATGKSGVDRLLGSLAPDLRLLHLCGADRRALEKPRQSITAVTVYWSKPIAEPNLPSIDGNIVLVHSPRAGQRLAELVGERSSTIIAAISPAAAEACGSGWQQVHAANEPTDDALLALAARLCNNSAPK